jgi:excisionase family DNA binding protein
MPVKHIPTVPHKIGLYLAAARRTLRTVSSCIEEVLVLASDRKPGVLKVMEVADELRIGRNQAYELVRSGQLRAVRIGQAIRVTREALEEFKAGDRARPA